MRFSTSLAAFSLFSALVTTLPQSLDDFDLEYLQEGQDSYLEEDQDSYLANEGSEPCVRQNTKRAANMQADWDALYDGSLVGYQQQSEENPADPNGGSLAIKICLPGWARKKKPVTQPQSQPFVPRPRSQRWWLGCDEKIATCCTYPKENGAAKEVCYGVEEWVRECNGPGEIKKCCMMVYPGGKGLDCSDPKPVSDDGP